MSNMLIVTIDLDWACEPAIDYTLRVMEELQVPVTVFATHRSAAVESRAENLEVGLHPYFGGNDSSHGSTIQQVVEHVMGIPHNLKAFRCHRFAGSNETDTAMLDAGMTISSNVCTDLEMIPPFRNRSGLLEVPIFMEDGGYLHRGHSLRGTSQLNRALQADGIKVLLLHPMHFALNTPHFDFMVNIKKRLSRTEWTGLSSRTLQDLRWHERGIADLLIDILKQTRNADFATVGDITAAAGAAPSQTLTFRRRA